MHDPLLGSKVLFRKQLSTNKEILFKEYNLAYCINNWTFSADDERVPKHEVDDAAQKLWNKP